MGTSEAHRPAGVFFNKPFDHWQPCILSSRLALVVDSTGYAAVRVHGRPIDVSHDTSDTVVLEVWFMLSDVPPSNEYDPAPERSTQANERVPILITFSSPQAFGARIALLVRDADDPQGGVHPRQPLALRLIRRPKNHGSIGLPAMEGAFTLPAMNPSNH